VHLAPDRCKFLLVTILGLIGFNEPLLYEFGDNGSTSPRQSVGHFVKRGSLTEKGGQLLPLLVGPWKAGISRLSKLFVFTLLLVN
jgi:hypothetical protein